MKLSKKLNNWPVEMRIQFTPTSVGANMRNLCSISMQPFIPSKILITKSISLDSLKVQHIVASAATTADEVVELVETARLDIVTPISIILSDDSGLEPNCY